MTQQAPSPAHIIRTHSSQVNVLSFSDDNERLYSGDLSGKVVVTSTRTLRSIAEWQAHKDGLLGVQEWGENVITHGRDNKLHVWTRVVAQASVYDAAVRSELAVPKLCYSLDVNALNFCRFSLLTIDQITSSPSSSSSPGPLQCGVALIATPNLVESSLADIWELPSGRRLHAAIGKLEARSNNGLDPEGRGSGILMSLNLFCRPTASTSNRLHLLSAYESGEVMLRRYVDTSKDMSIEGRGWELLWKSKKHVESVMAMAASHDHSFALTTSADHFIVKYKLIDSPLPSGDNYASKSGEEQPNVDLSDIRSAKYKIKQPGNGAIALHDSDRVCAVGGWDGKIRLYSTKAFKPLGSLAYHAKSCQAIAFARSNPTFHSIISDDEDDDMIEEEKLARSRWVAAGSQDHRISIWELMDFRRDAERQYEGENSHKNINTS